jgi:Asp-tRNA(Asn)/Glu-tRNA(Gln) amidotransferase C subunit
LKNKLTDLNNHLFAQLERLADEDLSPEDVEREVKRADAIVDVSDQVLRIADTGLKAAKLFAEHGESVLPHLPQIGSKAE